MKKLLLSGFLIFNMALAYGQSREWNGAIQTWSYDLTGSRDAAYTNSDVELSKAYGANFVPNNTSRVSTSATDVPGWFPAPSSTGNPASIQARGETNAQSKYTLLSGNRLQINSGNYAGKLSIRNIDNNKTTAIAKYSFDIKTNYTNAMTPPVARSYQFVFGSNQSGDPVAVSGLSTLFRTGGDIDGTEPSRHSDALFTAFRLRYQVSGTDMDFFHRKVTTKYVNPTTGAATYNTIVDGNAAFVINGPTRKFELFCNNSATDQYYVVNESTIETVASQTVHLWIDGHKIGEYDIANAGQAPIATGIKLDAFMINTTSGAISNTTDLDEGSIELSNFKVDYATTTSSTLPVTLSDFSGTFKNNSVKLNWKTLSEKNNSHFEVLRSDDGSNYNKIATQAGKGNSTQEVNYSLTDFNPLAGLNYYQLKQVDFNGNYSLSDAITVQAPLSNQDLKVSKKGDILEISYFCDNHTNVNISLSDVNGKRLYQKQVQSTAGNNQLSLPVSTLIKGVYILSVEGNGKAQRVKFVN